MEHSETADVGLTRNNSHIQNGDLGTSNFPFPSLFPLLFSLPLVVCVYSSSSPISEHEEASRDGELGTRKRKKDITLSSLTPLFLRVFSSAAPRNKPEEGARLAS